MAYVFSIKERIKGPSLLLCHSRHSCRERILLDNHLDEGRQRERRKYPERNDGVLLGSEGLEMADFVSMTAV